MSDVEKLAAALRLISSGRPFVSRDEVVWEHLHKLYAVLDDPADGEEETVIIRALVEVAGLHRGNIAQAAEARRRRTNALAAQAKRLKAQGYGDPYIAAQVKRSVDSVRRWRREGR